jgi:hypothetical protein
MIQLINKKIIVRSVGYALLAINGEPVNGRKLGERDVIEDILANENNFPINIKYYYYYY